MRYALVVLAIAIAIGAGALVVTAPSRDAAVPSWMASRVEAGRASLLENLDLVEPGSLVVLTAVHCRDDVAVRLVYRNRHLWLVERQYYTDAPAGWSSGSMAGGVLVEGEDPRTADDWLGGREEVDCRMEPSRSS